MAQVTRRPRRHERHARPGLHRRLDLDLAPAARRCAQAAAEARQALLDLASAKLGVPARRSASSKGVVSGGGKSVKYGELIGGKLFNVRMTRHGAAEARPHVQGRRHARRRGSTSRTKVTGKYTYMHNVRVPGMLHGRVVRPKGQVAYGLGAKPLSVDESSIKNIQGAQVIRKGDFVGVVAPHEYGAIQAAAQLKVEVVRRRRRCPATATSSARCARRRRPTRAASTRATSTPGSPRRRRSSRARTSTATRRTG